MIDGDMISTKQAGALLGHIDPRTLKKLPLRRVNVGAGKVRPVWRYFRSEVLALWAKRTVNPGDIVPAEAE